jgi:hypothetical protein
MPAMPPPIIVDNFKKSPGAASIWPKLSWGLAWAGTLLVGALLWWSQVRQIDARIAWFGWSPVGYVYQSAYPANFARDFSNGTQDYGFSLLIRLYKMAYLSFGIPPESLLPGVIALEIAMLALVAMWLCRVVRPEGSRIVSFFVALLIVSSWARDVDLAHYGHPFFEGVFYNIADAFRLLALLLALKNRLVGSGLLLAASFVVHPILGLLGVGFVLAMFALQPRQFLQLSGLRGLAVFLAVSVFWTGINVNPTGLSGGQLSADTWVTLTKFMSFHWYPLTYGTFSTEHAEHFLPLLSFLLLFAYYLGPPVAWRETEQRLVAGCVVMVALVLIGVFAPVLWPSPLLIKLALHRAGLLIATIGLVYITYGLYGEIESGPAWRRAVALLALLLPFVVRPGYSVLFSCVLILPAWGPLLLGRLNCWNVVIAGLAVASVSALGYYVLTGMARPWNADAYTGAASLLRVAQQHGGLGVTLLLVTLLLGSLRAPRPVLQMGVGTLVGLSALLWVFDQRTASTELVLSRAYEETQLWARDHTPENALFMPDPTIYYGWRDYSRRSSFGNLREWLYSGWAYTSDAQVYQDGLKRFAEFSIDLAPYLQAPDAYSGLKGYARLTRAVAHRYYTADDDWRMDMARRWGIDYFILRKDKLAATSGLRVAFENDRFVVLQSQLTGPKRTWRAVTSLDGKGRQPVASGRVFDWSTYSEGRPITWPWGEGDGGDPGQPGVYLRQIDQHDYWLYTGQGPVAAAPSGATADLWRVETPGSYRVSTFLKGVGLLDLYLWWYDAQGKPKNQHLASVRLSESAEPFVKTFNLPAEAQRYRMAFLLRGHRPQTAAVGVDSLIVEREEIESSVSHDSALGQIAP